MTDSPKPYIAVLGDVHGHLQLGLCVLARRQAELGIRLTSVYLCGDVGTFTAEDPPDSATRSHARGNPCELEFLTQWAADPPPPWLEAVFRPADAGGLGLDCPVIMVHGNHEGFRRLERLAPTHVPKYVADPDELPAVDRGGWIRYLPSGWRVAGPGGLVVAGMGGIDPAHRTGRYHPLAYVDPAAVARLGRTGPCDVLLTHQGPAAVQGSFGSPVLDQLLDTLQPRLWFHGHGVQTPDVTEAGPLPTRVVPLGDVTFDRRGTPHEDGFALIDVSDPSLPVTREAPAFLREFRRDRWTTTCEGLLVAPPLHRWAWPARA